MLKPQDILVILKLIAVGSKPWAYNKLAVELGMSPSEVHAAIKRALAAGLAIQNKDKIIPNIRNLEEFIIHGLKFVFVPVRGELLRGMVTSYAAAPLSNTIVADNEPPPVWPDPEGEIRGMAFSPLYKSAPEAARRDRALYELLVLVDGIRGGRAREREVAIKEFSKRMAFYTSLQKQEEGIKMDFLVEKYRNKILSLAKKNGILNVRVFGSMARNDAGPDSDLDLLVDIKKGKSGLSLGGFLVDVSKLIHRKVDVVTEKSLHPKIKNKVLHEARSL